MTRAAQPHPTADEPAPALQLCFAGLHSEAGELVGDVFWMLCLVAETFAVRVGGDLLFEEGAFPVLELASKLDRWLGEGLPRDAPLDYEVTGGDAGTLTIRRAPSGWIVDSVHRAAGSAEPPAVSDAAITVGIRAFVDELADEVGRRYAYDVRALLRRTASS